MKKLLLILLTTFILNLSFGQKIGDKVEIEWKGAWYPGKILKYDATKKLYYITYDGYDASWNEWVTRSRLKLKYAIGTKVQIEWKGAWYPGKILKYDATKNQYYITYDGYDASWNEWVGVDRLKL